MSEWIKVSERVPENKGEVLINSSTYGMRIGFFDAQRQCWDDGDYYDDITNVTHWMPLPEPPKD